MNPDQLWETTLDQNERILLSVKINEVDAANKAFESYEEKQMLGRNL